MIIGSDVSGQFFCSVLIVDDFNADNRADIVAATGIFGDGTVYVFYNDGSIPINTNSADAVIYGEDSSNLGVSLASGDMNSDGKTDLIIGAYLYSATDTGRTYIFYNGSITTENASGADIIITGETGSAFGISLICFDMNADGRLDLVVGGPYASSNKGRVYMYTFNDAVTSGGATSNYFGSALTSGDYNNDGKVDLAVGAYGYSTSTGRAYIFYGGSALDVSTSTADITITGNATSDSFGTSLSSGDLNADGSVDLVIGASG